jgi:hypothetical protein
MFGYLLKHIVLDTLYFPVWWYTRGFVRVMGWAETSLKEVERIAALKIWFKSMFKPMFQDYTKEGRIISFIMRVVLLIFKFLIVIIWAVFLAFVIVLFLTLPILTIGILLISLGYDLISLIRSVTP